MMHVLKNCLQGKNFLDSIPHINNLIASNYAVEYKFVICEALENMLVLVLTEEEKQKIMQEKNISFSRWE